MSAQNRYGTSKVLSAVIEHRGGWPALAGLNGSGRTKQTVDQREPIEEMEGIAVHRVNELALVVVAKSLAETVRRADVVPLIWGFRPPCPDSA